MTHVDDSDLWEQAQKAFPLLQLSAGYIECVHLVKKYQATPYHYIPF